MKRLAFGKGILYSIMLNQDWDARLNSNTCLQTYRANSCYFTGVNKDSQSIIMNCTGPYSSNDWHTPEWAVKPGNSGFSSLPGLSSSPASFAMDLLLHLQIKSNGTRGGASSLSRGEARRSNLLGFGVYQSQVFSPSGMKGHPVLYLFCR